MRGHWRFGARKWLKWYLIGPLAAMLKNAYKGGKRRRREVKLVAVCSHPTKSWWYGLHPHNNNGSKKWLESGYVLKKSAFNLYCHVSKFSGWKQHKFLISQLTLVQILVTAYLGSLLQAAIKVSTVCQAYLEAWFRMNLLPSSFRLSAEFISLWHWTSGKLASSNSAGEPGAPVC